jgi:hypothetical protein
MCSNLFKNPSRIFHWLLPLLQRLSLAILHRLFSFRPIPHQRSLRLPILPHYTRMSAPISTMELLFVVIKLLSVTVLDALSCLVLFQHLLSRLNHQRQHTHYYNNIHSAIFISSRISHHSSNHYTTFRSNPRCPSRSSSESLFTAFEPP